MRSGHDGSLSTLRTQVQRNGYSGWGGLPVRLGPLAAQPVVEPAEQPAVLLGGGPTLGIGHDVVDLAVLEALVAVGVGTAPVPDLDGPSGGPGEQPGGGAHLDPAPGLEHRPLQVGLVQPGEEGPGGEDPAPGPVPE